MSGKSYSVPGISTADHYVPAPAPQDGVFDAALNETREAIADQAEAERLAVDPGVANVRSAISSELTATANDWNARARTHYADPNRNRYKPEGLNAIDQAFDTQRVDALRAVRARLTERLERVEASVRKELDARWSLVVDDAAEDRALRVAAKLSHTTPANRSGILADLVRDAAADPALAYAVLPLLRSVAEKNGDWDSARAVETMTQLLEARPGIIRAREALKDVADAKRQLDHASHATEPWNAVPARMIVDGMTGEAVPAKGTAGMGLVWSGSEAAREMFGDPSHRDDEAASPGRSFWDLGAPPAGPLRTLKASETVLPDGEGEEE